MDNTIFVGSERLSSSCDVLYINAECKWGRGSHWPGTSTYKFHVLPRPHAEHLERLSERIEQLRRDSIANYDGEKIRYQQDEYNSLLPTKPYGYFTDTGKYRLHSVVDEQIPTEALVRSVKAQMESLRRAD